MSVRIVNQEFWESYYLIEGSPIKYHITVGLNQALGFIKRNIGPAVCSNCDKYGSIKGVFIGLCANCARIGFRDDTCSCYYKNGGNIAEYVECGGTGCNLECCAVKHLINWSNISKIGTDNYQNITHNYYVDKKGNVSISTHTRFEEEEEEDTSSSPTLSLVHPDDCINENYDDDEDFYYDNSPYYRINLS